jgi:hypothetical protein
MDFFYFLMRKNNVLLYFLVFSILSVSFIYILPCSAAIPVVKDGDLISYGYKMYAMGTLQSTRDESNPVQIRIRKINDTYNSINPPGLYDVLIGMKLGQIKTNVIIPPDEGFASDDPTFGFLHGYTLTFNNLRVFEINGIYYTETTPGSNGPFPWLPVVLGILGFAGIVFLSYGIYKFSPKIFGKRCSICKKRAVGKCKNCGAIFCVQCFSNGCPNCKSRSLIRFK